MDKKPRVLLAEDDEQIRTIVENLLVNEDYMVLAAVDGEDAWEEFKRFHIDRQIPFLLLITDINMPHLSGPKLAQRLRAYIPNLPVLFISGGMSLEQENEITSFPEPKSFLSKPFRFSPFQNAIDKLLSK